MASNRTNNRFTLMVNHANRSGFQLSKRTTAPNGRSPTTTVTAGQAQVYYTATSGYVFLGIIYDRTKLVHFSSVARHQLEVSMPSRIPTLRGKHQVFLNLLDDEAGLHVMWWINENNIHNPKQLDYNDPTFELDCRVYHACNVFGINRSVRGNIVRQRIFEHIHKIFKITDADFQAAVENLYFDSGLMKIIFKQVAYHLLRGWIETGELEKIWSYIQAQMSEIRDYLLYWTELYYQEELEKTKKEDEAKRQAAEALTAYRSRVLDRTTNEATVVHPSAAGPPQVVRRRPRRRPGPSDDTLRRMAQASSSAAATRPTTSNVSNKPDETAAIENSLSKMSFGNVGGSVGAVTPGRSFAQAMATSQGKGKGKGKNKDEDEQEKEASYQGKGKTKVSQEEEDLKQETATKQEDDPQEQSSIQAVATAQPAARKPTYADMLRRSGRV